MRKVIIVSWEREKTYAVQMLLASVYESAPLSALKNLYLTTGSYQSGPRNRKPPEGSRTRRCCTFDYCTSSRRRSLDNRIARVLLRHRNMSSVQTSCQPICLYYDNLRGPTAHDG